MPYNILEIKRLMKKQRELYPNKTIWCWSGYTYEELKRSGNPHILDSLQLADVLIDGPYIEAERDLTLPMRGSRNQRVIDLKEKI